MNYLLWLMPLTTSATFVFCGLLRRWGLRANIMAIPTSRSSHSTPTPQTGGIAIVSIVTLLLGALWAAGILPFSNFLIFSLGGCAIAVVGYGADRERMTIPIRLAWHFAIAFGVVWYSGGIPPIPVGNGVVEFEVIGSVVGCIAIVWAVNLFNFLDGIDGIAATEAIFVTAAGAGFAISTGIDTAMPVVSFVIAAAVAGFLVWNWSPARLFMGDVGSGYLGYVIAVLALTAARENGVMIFVWLILGGVFFVDATATLLRRLLQGEKAHLAHRTHAYQRLARRWNSHRRVTLVVCAINVFWLCPIAWLCLRYPSYAIALVVLALTPLAILALTIGAGKAESAMHSNPQST